MIWQIIKIGIHHRFLHLFQQNRCYIPLRDSNDAYFVRRREELNKELSEQEPVDFDAVIDRVLKNNKK